MARKPRVQEAVSFDDDPLWYKDAIIYELHVRAFHDSNGDGIGDFRGLIEKLDYLQDLGVTAIWLLPFYPSPLRDDGYDIADYTDVNPIYGTLDDFKTFLARPTAAACASSPSWCINHTSDQHPWFQRARRSPPGSPERDFYVWSDTPDKYQGRPHHLQGLRAVQLDLGPASPRPTYWHRFYSHQPDLNFDNPAVARGHVRGARFLAGPGRGRPAAGRRALPLRARGHQLREPAGDARLPQEAAPARR